jgi:protein-arginine deiminase
MSRITCALVLCSVAACGGEDVNPGGPDGGTTGIDACVGSGCTTPDPDAPPPPPAWSFNNVYGVANLDDDDGTTRDWEQAPFAADDDMSKLVLPGDTLGLGAGTVQLTLTSSSLTNIRIYRANVLVLGGTAGGGPLTITPDGSDVELAIEFGNFSVAGQLEITSGSNTWTSKLQAAPLLMNHHLQPAEHVWAVRVSDNASFINSYSTVLGTKFTSVSGSTVGSDVWIQDEFEFGTTTGEGNTRLDVVIDSVRDRGLDGYAEAAWVGPDTIAAAWGNPNTATSYDSFGNLEASPPVTVNGVAYPFGKIYYGRVGTSGLNSTLGNFLASQKVQAPFQLPTNWLCVGHVDEYSSFLPDPASPKGFKLVIADVPAALAVLGAIAPSATLPYYGQDHGYPTVGSILADTALIALNNDLQADYLDPIIAKFKTELGLTDADIIKVPSLFETVSNCGGRVAALIPGMANLIVANVDGQTTHVFTADPFFRSTTNQATDPMITAFKAASSPTLQWHFIDDWDTYHLGLGEVHCGTNVRRTPTASWWTTAGHLMGSN